MRYNSVSSSARMPAGAALAAWHAHIGRHVIQGAFRPAPRGRRLVLERRSGGRWRRVAVMHTSQNGRYLAVPTASGLFRVRSGSVAGPAIRLR
jgi:hypothetical protein